MPATGVAVGLGVGVGVGVCVGLGVGDGVWIGVGVGDGVCVGLGVGDGVAMGVGVGVGAGVAVAVAIGVGEAVAVSTGVGDAVALVTGVGVPPKTGVDGDVGDEQPDIAAAANATAPSAAERPRSLRDGRMTESGWRIATPPMVENLTTRYHRGVSRAFHSCFWARSGSFLPAREIDARWGACR